MPNPNPEFRPIPDSRFPNVRSFVALNLSPNDRQALHEAARPIREAAGAASWVTADNLHLTLKFLGEVEAGRVEALGGRLCDAAIAHRRMTLDLGGAGVFPNPRAPRIVWMGVAPDPRLELLYHDVERVCIALGFASDGRPFRPHVTLGRLKGNPGSAERHALLEAMRRCTFNRRVTVDSVDLMRSTPGPNGSRYDVVMAASLGGHG